MMKSLSFTVLACFFLVGANVSANEKSTPSSSGKTPAPKPNSSQGTSVSKKVTYASPQGRRTGIGIQLGIPAALTFKTMFKSDQAVQVHLGGFQGGITNLSLGGDYLWYQDILARAPEYALTWFVGAGGFITAVNYGDEPWLLGFRLSPVPSRIWVGGRLPIGLNLALTHAPVELYLDTTPYLLAFPYLTMDLGVALGFRFFF